MATPPPNSDSTRTPLPGDSSDNTLRMNPAGSAAGAPPQPTDDSALRMSVHVPGGILWPAGTPPEVAAAGPDARVGKYVRVSKLGSGGMGSVWKCWDLELSRWVALKLLKSEDDVGWLRREAQMAGRLTHPNIAAVHEIGSEGDRHYIAMQLIDGKSMGDLGKIDRKELVGLVRDVARAVGVAHAQDIVHRDIKPDNVMVVSKPKPGAGGKVEWDRHVYVMDFGLARPTHGRSDLTLAGSAVGTPLYMAPEQARGENVDARADVYSLGATLYELLAGLPPIYGKDARETMMLLQSRDPVPLSAVDASIDEDLQTIVHKCLEKKKDKRYENATELAEELTRWLEGRAILARPPGAMETMVRAVRVHATPGRFAMAAGALLLLAAGIGLPLFLAARSREARSARALKLGARVGTAMTEGELHARDGDMEPARAKLDEAIEFCRKDIQEGDYAEPHMFLARLYRARGWLDPAMGELDRALELDDELAEARLERGLLRLGQYEARMIACRIGMGNVRKGPGPPLPPTRAELEAEFPELRLLRKGAQEDLAAKGDMIFVRPVDRAFGNAELIRLRGDLAAAKSALERIKSDETRFIPAYLSLARLASEEGRFEDGIALCTQAVGLHKGHAEAHFVRGLLRMQYGQGLPVEQATATWEQAEQDFSKAIELGLDSVDVWESRGIMRHARGSYADAEFDYSKALERDSRRLMSLVHRGAVRIMMGKNDEGVADIEAGLRVAPQNWPYRQAYLDAITYARQPK